LTDRPNKTLLATTERALAAAETFLAAARARFVARLAPDGAMAPERFTAEQLAGHAFAWMASYVEALRQLRNWAVRLDDGGMFGEAEALILEIAYGEYIAQLAGGIPMAQGEFARPQDFGLADEEVEPLRAGEAGALSAGLGPARVRLGTLLGESGGFGHIGIEDATLEMIRDQVRRFAARTVADHL